MLVDRYTKTVLSVIAAALVAIVAQNTIKVSQAQGNQIQKFALCSQNNPNNCVDVSDVQGGGNLKALVTKAFQP
jgi:hypothetical protein